MEENGLVHALARRTELHLDEPVVAESFSVGDVVADYALETLDGGVIAVSLKLIYAGFPVCEEVGFVEGEGTGRATRPRLVGCFLEPFANLLKPDISIFYSLSLVLS